MQSFFDHTASTILENHNYDLKNVQLVFPNNRMGFFFKNALKRNLKKQTFAPKIDTLFSFIESFSSSILIDNLAQLTYLLPIYSKLFKDIEFSEFLSVGNTFLADFEEIDAELVDPEILFKDIYNLKSLQDFLEDDPEKLAFKFNYEKFWLAFKDCYFEFNKLLNENGFSYKGKLLKEVAEKVIDLKPTSSKIYFIGFTHLTKSEEKIVQHFTFNFNAEFIIDADTYFLESETQEAGKFYRKYKHSWKKKSFQFEESYISNPLFEKKITSIGVSKKYGQAKVVGHILEHELKITAENAAETAIILLDETLLESVIYNMPTAIESLNISMGLPLSETSLAEFIKSLQKLFTTTKINKELENCFYYKDLNQFLLHPYSSILIENKHDNSTIKIILSKIISQNLVQVTLLDIAEESEIKEISFLQNVPKTASDLLILYKKINAKLISNLSAMEYKSNQLLDIQILNTFQGILDLLSQRIDENWTIEMVNLLIQNHFQNTRIPFESDYTKGLQLMGMMETRGLDFKNVILLSCNEGTFPSSKFNHSYIPNALRIGKMMMHTDRDAISSYLFYRLIQRAENIYTIYNTDSDVLGGGEKSRFILQCENELKKLPNIQFCEKTFILDTDFKQDLNLIEIKKEKEIITSIQNQVENVGLSASALNTYISCSLKYYFQYILNLREEEEVEEVLESNTIGSAVHFALETIYTPFLDKELDAKILKNISDKEIENLIITYLEKNRFNRKSFKNGQNFLLFNTCILLVKNFIKNDIKRIEVAQKSNTKIHLQGLEKKLDTIISEQSISAKIIGNIDRIEEIENVIQICDFKTGTQISKSKILMKNFDDLFSDPNNSKVLQLLFYALLYKKNFPQSDLKLKTGIFWLRDFTIELDTLFINKEENIISNSYLDEFEKELLFKISELLNPEISISQTLHLETCNYCNFNKICGRDLIKKEF